MYVFAPKILALLKSKQKKALDAAIISNVKRLRPSSAKDIAPNSTFRKVRSDAPMSHSFLLRPKLSPISHNLSQTISPARPQSHHAYLFGIRNDFT